MSRKRNESWMVTMRESNAHKQAVAPPEVAGRGEMVSKPYEASLTPQSLQRKRVKMKMKTRERRPGKTSSFQLEIAGE